MALFWLKFGTMAIFLQLWQNKWWHRKIQTILNKLQKELSFYLKNWTYDGHLKVRGAFGQVWWEWRNMFVEWPNMFVGTQTSEHLADDEYHIFTIHMIFESYRLFSDKPSFQSSLLRSTNLNIWIRNLCKVLLKHV